jgi:hypothetical protein
MNVRLTICCFLKNPLGYLVQLQRRLVEQRDELVSRTTGELTSECWRTGSRSESPNFRVERYVAR